MNVYIDSCVIFLGVERIHVAFPKDMQFSDSIRNTRRVKRSIISCTISNLYFKSERLFICIGIYYVYPFYHNFAEMVNSNRLNPGLTYA